MRIIHRLAQRDIKEAYQWYRFQSVKAANRFADDVRESLLAIELFPDRFPIHEHGTRALILRRFPYVIVYLVENDRPFVVAVAHAKRRPGYWRRRLRRR